MKIERGFSLVIASQPFQVLGCHGSWIIRAILDRSGPFSELKGPFRTILDRLKNFGQFWTIQGEKCGVKNLEKVST